MRGAAGGLGLGRGRRTARRSAPLRGGGGVGPGGGSGVNFGSASRSAPLTGKLWIVESAPACRLGPYSLARLLIAGI